MATARENKSARPPKPKGKRGRGKPPVSDAKTANVPRSANSIHSNSQASRKGPAPRPPNPNGSKASAGDPPRDRAREVPDEVRRRFTQVGNEFFFPDGTLAFADRGHRITSASENTEVIRSLVAIAQARGWTGISISGTERFRREVWTSARHADLQARGYRPSAYDEAKLARSASGQASVAEEQVIRPQGQERAAQDSERPKQRAPAGTLWVGRLAGHGLAPYRHDPKARMSYFVRLEGPSGEREIWGVDLQRALKESVTQPGIGDEVGLRAVGREAVTVRAPAHDNNGNTVRGEERTVHRNRWVLEERGFFEKRAQAARVVRDASQDPKAAVNLHPELAGTYLTIRASELAAKDIRDPLDRRRFVAAVRRALADEVARGEPLIPIRLKHRDERQISPRNPEPDHAPAR